MAFVCMQIDSIPHDFTEFLSTIVRESLSHNTTQKYQQFPKVLNTSTILSHDCLQARRSSIDFQCWNSDKRPTSLDISLCIDKVIIKKYCFKNFLTNQRNHSAILCALNKCQKQFQCVKAMIFSQICCDVRIVEGAYPIIRLSQMYIAFSDSFTSHYSQLKTA